MYECHITIVEDRPREQIKQAVEAIGWKFSAIDGDPLLGDGVYCYATKWITFPNVDRVLAELEVTAAHLVDADFKVKRTKVELVVYDVQHKEV